MDDQRGEQKTYGDLDPVPLTTGSGDFLAADNVTATYSRAPGETVLGGPYHITATLARGVLTTTPSPTRARASRSTRGQRHGRPTRSKTMGTRTIPLTTGSGDFLAADT